MRPILAFLALATLLFAAQAGAQPAASPAAPGPISLEDFLRRDVFGTVKLSPTGEYIAATRPLDDRTILVILRRSDLRMTGHVTPPVNVHVADFDWVSDERILFTIGEKAGELERPSPTGEIFAVNADGTGQGAAIFGFRSEGRGSRFFGGSVIDDLPDDDNYVLVGVQNGSEFSQVDRMHVESGRRIVVARAPVRRASFVVDPQHRVRFAVGAGADNRVKTYYRDDDDSEWVLINDEAVTERAVSPVGFSADGRTAYLEIEESEGPNGIYAFDTATRERRPQLRDDNVDPFRYLTSPTDGSVYGVVFMDGWPRVEYIEPENPFARLHQSLSASFPEQGVFPSSYSADGNLALFAVFSDRNPGEYYLFDRAANQASFVVSRNSWIPAQRLAEMKPITVRARDGLVLEGYLTLPPGSDGRNLPLVVHPHGGPFGPYDMWGYDPEVQLMASRGYAVLQLNFRGSGNYGRAFRRAGYREWGGTMQDDLTDATRWAIQQGIADPRRICIYGASYGGYASLMGVVKEPDLYACAIGNVGVYDMPAMYHSGDIPETESGENFLEEALGERDLESASPNHQAERIRVPVMLAAGREDVRAPPLHTERMRDALQRLGKPVETVIYEGEGHGNYLPENRLDFARRVLDFLDRHIGPGRAQPASATTP
jgi:dipeptidyl aminopeptidase/acylaminoacyl peptidase